MLQYNFIINIYSLTICVCWFKNNNFSNRAKLKLGDAFVGYQDDTPAAVVFQAYHYLKATKQWEVEDEMSEEQKDQVSYKSTYNKASLL